MFGSIVGMPPGASDFGMVRDEYGNTRSVDRGELEEDLEDNDDVAYRVDFYSSKAGPTLRDVEYD